MCGRTTLASPVDQLKEIFDLEDVPPLTPRYNIAPTQMLPVMRERGRLELVRWGLVINASSARRPLINVRSESVARNRAFVESFRNRRCLVLVDGFYEWKTEGKRRAPFILRRPDHQPFALAAIWDTVLDAKGTPLPTCAILTAPALAPILDLHHRQPIVIPKRSFAQWLTPNAPARDLLHIPQNDLIATEVSDRVNRMENDDEGCVREEGSGQLAFA